MTRNEFKMVGISKEKEDVAMKKTGLTVLIVVLFFPALGLAQQDETRERPRRDRVERPGESLNFEELRGEIISVSKNEVTIAAGSADKPEQIKISIPERRAELRGLLGQGLGQKAELRCYKTRRGTWALLKIEGIEGVDVPSQSPSGPGEVGERPHHKDDEFSPEQRERLRDRFRAVAQRLKENPELREELKKLAKEDIEAFRQRIRRIHQLAGESIRGPDQPRGDGMAQRGRGGPMPDQRGWRRGQSMPPQIAEFERQSRELAEQYRRAEGRDREELGNKLQDRLAEIFDEKAEAQEKEVRRLEKQLEKLRKRLEKRQSHRKAIIQGRFEELTGQEDDELSW